MQSGLDTLTQLLDELAKTESQRSLLDVAKRQIFSNPTDNLSDKQVDEEVIHRELPKIQGGLCQGSELQPG